MLRLWKLGIGAEVGFTKPGDGRPLVHFGRPLLRVRCRLGRLGGVVVAGQAAGGNSDRCELTVLFLQAVASTAVCLVSRGLIQDESYREMPY